MIRYKKRTWMVLLGMFIAVFSFTFLMAKFKDNDGAQAANAWNFNAGYIISDWQMGNYSSMNEAQIQAFLTEKNPCNNRDRALYVEQSATYKGVTWHWSGDHFVCLSEERFGDGLKIGSGETAAHIIWQAAQDYQINPQVLIVLLEKESGLITDEFPHSGQYKTAAGFGCPDTAACDSRYFGFKNQVRRAAEMFREVLDGGWSNYPVGPNYIQYNPNAACGGTVVNVQNRATSALYRYTPYQPNQSALAAGYGSGDACGAYGNRNFYLWFEDWFGGITSGGNASYVAMTEPRYMITASRVSRYKSSGERLDTLEAGRMLKFTSKTTLPDGAVCLRTESSTASNENACVRMDQLENVDIHKRNVSAGENTEKIIRAGATKYRIRGEDPVETFTEEMVRTAPVTAEFNGKKYYVTEFDRDNSDSEYGFLASDVREAPGFSNMNPTVVYFAGGNANRVNPVTNQITDPEFPLMIGSSYVFSSYAVSNGMKYYRTEHNTANGLYQGVSEREMENAVFTNFEEPRYMRLKGVTKRVNPITGEVYDTLEAGREIRFTTKIMINGKWYYRTEFNSNHDEFYVISSDDVAEI